jgi:hypothetical protein
MLQSQLIILPQLAQLKDHMDQKDLMGQKVEKAKKDLMEEKDLNVHHFNKIQVMYQQHLPQLLQ